MRTGHYTAERGFSAIPTTAGVVDVVTEDPVEARSVGEYGADVGKLLDGDLEAEDFRRRWEGRDRRVGELTLEADPDRIVAMLTESGPPLEPFYRRGIVRRRA
ncbi:MAG: hypothetical protein ACYCU7_03235 [Acidimicrobiales bacterium]